LNSKVIRKMLS